MVFGLLELFATLACVREGGNLCGLIWSACRAHRKTPSCSGDEPPITIVIPVYEEVDIIGQTCSYFSEVVDSFPKCDLVVCGTARERQDGVNPTLQRAIAASRDNPRVRVIETPVVEGLKAEQLHFAFRNVERGADTIFGIYDVDSRPNPAVVAEVRAQYERSRPDIIQQHALFVGNMAVIERKPLQIGQALYQSRWTLAHEVPRFQLYRLNITPFVHLVGHGLFIQRQTVESFGGIPTGTVVDDAHLGLFATASRLKIASLRSFDISDNPESLRETFRQLIGWSRGPLDISSYIRSFEASGLRISSMRRSWIKVVAYIYWFQWIATTPAILSLLAMVALGWTAAIVWLTLYIADFILAYYVIRENIRGQKMPGVLYATFAMLLFASVCSIPAFVAAFLKLTGIKIKKYKTSHRPV